MAGQDRLQKVLIDGAWIESAGRESFQAVNPQTGTELGEIYPVSPWPEVERAAAGGQCGRLAGARMDGGAVCHVFRGVCRAVGEAGRGTGGDGPCRDGAGGFAAVKRRRVAADGEPIAAGGGGRSRRVVGAGDDRHQGQHPLDVRADRAGGCLRAEQFSVCFQRGGRRRFRGGGRGREPRHRQGAFVPSGHFAALGRGGARRRP